MQNNNWLKVVGIVVLVIIVSLLTIKFSGSSSTAGSDLKQKVLSTGVIRAGYVVYPPEMIKDPNTGKLSGIFYDSLEAAAKKLSLKVDWVEEVNWGTMIEGLKMGRYDIVGSPVWPSSERAREADFTIPLTYSVIVAASRANDNRFDKSFDAMNSKEVKISIIDGELAQSIVKEQLPNITVVPLTQLSDKTQSLLDLVSGKADVSFVEPIEIDRFLKNNPGTIKSVQPNNPLRTYGNVMMINNGQEAFKSMLNVALAEEINSGYVDSLVKEYASANGTYYPVAKPFSLPIK